MITEASQEVKMQTGNSMPLTQIQEALDDLAQQRATGSLILSTHAEEGRLHLFYGRLIYATGGSHRTRRWNRAINKHCPKWNAQFSDLSLEDEKPWEYQYLYQGIVDKQLNLSQAKSVIQNAIIEVLFCLSHYPDLTLNWEANTEVKSELSLGLALSYRQIQPLFNYVGQMISKWQTAGLGNLSGNLAPIAKKPLSPTSLSGWGKYLNGQYTLWDIANEQDKSIVAVTRSLLPLMQKGYLRFQQVSDLPAPASTQAEVPSPKSRTAKTPPLIACIDDSPVIGQALKKILEPAGYRVLHLSDPVQALTQLAQQKPDLIFLDLVMPNANGYTVCQFLRNAQIFERIPVIILTSRDNMIERSRAKLAGATDFLAKPPKPAETLQMVKKYLVESSVLDDPEAPLTFAPAVG